MTSKSVLRGEGFWLRGPGSKRDIPGVESRKSLFFGVEVGEGVGIRAVRWVARLCPANKPRLSWSKRGLSPNVNATIIETGLTGPGLSRLKHFTALTRVRS
jgi:hypothetical protein